jgi:AraC family transcriptional regulator, regulatory protein of adaptative response / methylated-DNA-[protein]-cysteine methyltransferase
LNLRPSGYEPDELPGCSTPHQSSALDHFGPGEKTRDIAMCFQGCKGRFSTKWGKIKLLPGIAGDCPFYHALKAGMAGFPDDHSKFWDAPAAIFGDDSPMSSTPAPIDTTPKIITCHEARYRFIARTDKTEDQDGYFFTAILTTGIYCKPSCRARTPKRENTRFFDSAEAARKAGFRPCKKCHPDGDPHTTNMEKIARHIADNPEENLSLAALAKMAALSPSRFQRVFKRIIGLSPKKFHQAVLHDNFRKNLRAGKTITEAIYAAGYQSSSRAYETSTQKLGMTPSRYKTGGADEEIFYAIRPSAFGLLSMAATKKGVCLVQFGDDKNLLQKSLQQEFPKARLTPASPQNNVELEQWVTALENYLQGTNPAPNLPLDLRGTAFQMKVWDFLQSIPEGQTLTYGELAKAIGKPKAARAVGTACGRNRVGVLVPCHRILAGNGGFGGYRWGLPRKQKLLELEKK